MPVGAGELLVEAAELSVHILAAGVVAEFKQRIGQLHVQRVVIRLVVLRVECCALSEA